MRVEMNICLNAQAGAWKAGDADELCTLTFDNRHDGHEFLALAGIGQRDDDVVRGDHAEVAMACFTGMDEVGRRAGTGHGGGNLACDVTGLPHTADDDSTAAGQDEVQCMQEGVVETLAECPDRGGFDVEHFACKVERAGGCG